MDDRDGRLRVVAAVPLSEASCRLIEDLEPRVEIVRAPSLMRPMRGPADWSGDPSFTRTADQQAEFDAMVDSADVLFGIPDVDSAALARTVAANQGLRWVMTTAAGGGSQIREANLSKEALERIVFTTSAGVHGRPLAEFALFGILAGAKDLPRLVSDKSAAKWPDRWEMRQVSEMTVLILGLGGIGAECARLLGQSGMCVWGLSRHGKAVRGVQRIVAPEELADALHEVDAVVVALPETKRTRHLVDAKFLSALKPGTILVNVGRGNAIDEGALVQALNEGRLSFAALDVFEVEPLPAASPLWGHPRVLLSPHTAALNAHEERRIARRFAKNATRFLDGRRLQAVVNTVEFY